MATTSASSTCSTAASSGRGAEDNYAAAGYSADDGGDP